MASKETELNNIAWALRRIEKVQSATDDLICKEVIEQSPEIAELLALTASRIDAVLHTERETLAYYQTLTAARA